MAFKSHFTTIIIFIHVFKYAFDYINFCVNFTVDMTVGVAKQIGVIKNNPLLSSTKSIFLAIC